MRCPECVIASPLPVCPVCMGSGLAYCCEGEDALDADSTPLKGATVSHNYSLRPVRYRLLSDTARMPTKSYEGDAGFDLYVSRTAEIEPNGFFDIDTDLAVQLPPGVWAEITGRSSTLRKRRLLVNHGVVDNGYTGHLFVGVYNLSRRPVVIRPGDRIAQLILHPIVSPDWLQIEEFAVSDRGEKGFGSSGN